jgi:type VI secretion system FHA domain protein
MYHTDVENLAAYGHNLWPGQRIPVDGSLMALTLEVVGHKAAQMGGSARKVFQTGGTIGRLRDNDWVLPDEYISGRHAKILFSGGQYLIEDTSTNGVFVGSPQNRITKGQPYALRDGDTLYIDDYEVRVTIGADASSRAPDPYDLSAYGTGGRSAPLIPEDPLLVPVASEGGSELTDPLALLGIQDAGAAPAGPSAASLAGTSPLSDHYRPPAAPPLPPSSPASPRRQSAAPQAGGSLIPDDYDPFAPDEPAAAPPVRPAPSAPARPAAASGPPVASRPAAAVPAAPVGAPAATVVTAPMQPARAAPAPRPAPTAPVESTPAARPAARAPAPPRAPASSPAPAPAPRANPAPPPPPQRSAPSSHSAAGPSAAGLGAGNAPVSASAASGNAAGAGARGNLDFAALLAAAGMDEARVTPELSAQFGQILRVVVSGLMDVLRARERIKDEFRMRVTTFKQQDNNPLKFSANVEDALHNLLVKRNAAYLGPVEAFDDAFADLRNHQMAMLAGMRVAYESMLAEFEPERLQEDFDRHVKAGSFLSGPAKLKYWELYRNRFHDMVKDADSSFRRLFGDEFAKAYEEQLAKLKALNRAERC